MTAQTKRDIKLARRREFKHKMQTLLNDFNSKAKHNLLGCDDILHQIDKLQSKRSALNKTLKRDIEIAQKKFYYRFVFRLRYLPELEKDKIKHNPSKLRYRKNYLKDVKTPFLEHKMFCEQGLKVKKIFEDHIIKV